MGRQLGASRCRRSCTTVCAASCDRAPGTLWVMQHADNLGELLDHHPQPEDMRAAAQPTPQFIELKMREGEIVEVSVVERCAMFPGTAEPGGDSRVAMAKEGHGGGHRKVFGQCCQYLPDAVGCCLEALQRRRASRTQGSLACLAAEGPDTFAFPVSAVTDHCMDLGIGDPILGARAIRAGEALGVDPPHRATATFHLPLGRHGRRGGCRGRHQLAAGRTRIRRVWPGALWAQPLDSDGDGGAAPLRVQPTPVPRQLGQSHHEQHKRAPCSRHR